MKVLMKYTWKKIFIGGTRISFVVKLICKYWINIVKPTSDILLTFCWFVGCTVNLLLHVLYSTTLFHELPEINWFATIIFLRPGFIHTRFDITFIWQSLTFMARNIGDEEGLMILAKIYRMRIKVGLLCVELWEFYGLHNEVSSEIFPHGKKCLTHFAPN